MAKYNYLYQISRNCTDKITKRDKAMGTVSADSAVTKIVWQYSMLLPEETMEFLRGIAADCCKVKNAVYGKYEIGRAHV